MLNFVVALQAEANPIIKSYKLKHHNNRYFSLYISDNVTLIVSGIGRNHASAATAWLAAIKPADVWINVGIAGHSASPLGTLFSAHKICEFTTGKCWYPVHINSTIESENLTTFDQVQTNYQADTLHDMEASGFYQSALRFSTAELTHSVKIVSDNSIHSVNQIDKAVVEDLVGSNIDKLQEFSSHLCELANEIQVLDPDILMQQYLQRWRFSVTQKHQLHRLLQRRSALSAPSTRSNTEPTDDTPGPLPEELTTKADASDVLTWLRRDIETQALHY